MKFHEEGSKNPIDRSKIKPIVTSQFIKGILSNEAEIRKKVNSRLHAVLGEKYQYERLKRLQRKMNIVDAIILLCTIFSAIFAVVASESFITFVLGPDETLDKVVLLFQTNATVTTCRSLVTFVTVIIEVLLVVHYFLLIEFYKFKDLLYPEDNLFSSGFYKYLLIEMFLNIFHSPPYFDYVIPVAQRDPSLPEGKFQSDYFLTILLLFFRSYQIIKYFAFYSKWNSYYFEKICMESKSPPSLMFVIKAEFKNRPFVLLGITMIISIFVFGYSLRSIEMFFMTGGDPSRVQDWRFFWNGLWCIIITMSTVGFGDFYPISVLGRIIAVISCFWGAFLISMMVAGLTIAVEFNSQESISYESIKSAHYDLEYGTLATILLQNSFRYFSHLKSARLEPNLASDRRFRMKKSELFLKLKESTFQFRKIRACKIDTINSIEIEKSLHKIDSILNVDVEKIKSRANAIVEVETLLEKYHFIQSQIKEKSVELYKELEEMNIFKEKYSFK